MHAYRRAVEKRNYDKVTAVENINVTNVSINGYILSLEQVRWFAVQFGVRFRSDTHYWYDVQGGFLGKLGGPVKWIVDPEIPVWGYLHPRSSLGMTQIYINEREITEQERKLWLGVSMQLLPNTQYLVEADGTTSRVGDDLPLYNWHDKIRIASKGMSAKLGLSTGLLAAVATGVVKGVASILIAGELRGVE